MNANPPFSPRLSGSGPRPQRLRPAGPPVASGRVVAALLGLVAFLAGACASPLESTAPTEPAGPWERRFEPPAPPATDRLVLEPLGPEHAGREHAALLSTADHLRATVFDSWPPADYDIAQNQKDLARHAAEFARRDAYAWAVLAPDRETYLGALFAKPVRASEGEGDAVQITYWVVAREIPRGMDEQLLRTSLAWFQHAWPFVEVLLPLRVENRRAAGLARAAGMVERPPPSFGYRLFAWTRGS